MESDCWTLQEEERGTAATSFLHQLYKNREPGKGLLEGESSYKIHCPISKKLKPFLIEDQKEVHQDTIEIGNPPRYSLLAYLYP